MRFRFPSIALLAAFIAAPALAQNAAELPPMDSGTFIHIENFADHRKALKDDPFIRFIESRAEWQELTEWQSLKDKMEMDGEQIADAYFGKEVVIFGEEFTTDLMVPVAEGEGDNGTDQKRMSQEEYREKIRNMSREERQEFFREGQAGQGIQSPGMVFTRVTKADADHLFLKMNFEMLEPIADFAVFRNEEKTAFFCWNGQWMGIASTDQEAYFRTVLRDMKTTKRLVDDDEFIHWMLELPEKRMAAAMIRSAVSDQLHVFALERANRSLVMHYAGVATFLDTLIKRLGTAETLPFGPMPKQTIAAYSANFNIIDWLASQGPGGVEPGNNRRVEMLERIEPFFEGKSMENDIIPFIDAPTVFFVGELEPELLEENPGYAVPVIGMAFKLKNDEVGEILDKGFDNIMNLAAMASAAAGGEPIRPKTINHAGATLRMMDLGPLIAKQWNKPDARHMARITYGKIGSWYLFCNHDMFFKYGVNAQPDDFASAKRRKAEGLQPMFRLFVNPDRASKMLKDWSTSPTFKNMVEMDLNGKLILTELSTMANGYEHLDLTIYKREDNVTIGRMELIRKDADELKAIWEAEDAAKKAIEAAIKAAEDAAEADDDPSQPGEDGVSPTEQPPTL